MRASVRPGLGMQAVLISTVASAVGLTQVYLPKGVGPRGTCGPAQFTPSRTAVFTPLKPVGSWRSAGRAGKSCTQKLGSIAAMVAENLGPWSRLDDSINHTQPLEAHTRWGRVCVVLRVRRDLKFAGNKITFQKITDESNSSSFLPHARRVSAPARPKPRRFDFPGAPLIGARARAFQRCRFQPRARVCARRIF